MNKRQATQALKRLTRSGWTRGYFIHWTHGDYSIVITDDYNKYILHTYEDALLYIGPHEETRGHPKLTVDDVRKLRTIKGQLSTRKAGALFAISATQVSRIWSGKSRKEP